MCVHDAVLTQTRREDKKDESPPIKTSLLDICSSDFSHVALIIRCVSGTIVRNYLNIVLVPSDTRVTVVFGSRIFLTRCANPTRFVPALLSGQLMSSVVTSPQRKCTVICLPGKGFFYAVWSFQNCSRKRLLKRQSFRSSCREWSLGLTMINVLSVTPTSSRSAAG
jgi:hypothetical protein